MLTFNGYWEKDWGKGVVVIYMKDKIELFFLPVIETPPPPRKKKKEREVFSRLCFSFVSSDRSSWGYYAPIDIKDNSTFDAFSLTQCNYFTTLTQDFYNDSIGANKRQLISLNTTHASEANHATQCNSQNFTYVSESSKLNSKMQLYATCLLFSCIGAYPGS